MLRNIRDIEGFAIRATDGLIGHVRDVYFDDDAWVVRYFVVYTTAPQIERHVLISPFALKEPDWSTKVLPVKITRAQVENSPDIDTDKPVSRQHEMGYLGYYGYPNYWGGGGLWGAGLYPDMLQGGLEPHVANAANAPARPYKGKSQSAFIQEVRPNDIHLRSANDVMRYYVHASDGEIGHVHGLLVEEQTWAIRYLIVDTSNWWLGHDVLISPDWIADIDWPESKVMVSLSREAVKNAPIYDRKAQLDRPAEAALHAHHGRPAYWPPDSPHDRSAGHR